LDQVRINVAAEYSTHPLGRERSVWPFGGERFREDFLEPRLRGGEAVVVDLRGVRGLAPSFLEEAFGGLIDAGFTYDDIARLLTIVTDDTARERQIWRYIRVAAGLPLSE